MWRKELKARSRVGPRVTNTFCILWTAIALIVVQVMLVMDAVAATAAGGSSTSSDGDAAATAKMNSGTGASAPSVGTSPGSAAPGSGILETSNRGETPARPALGARAASDGEGGGSSVAGSSSSNGSPLHPTFRGWRVSDRVVSTNYGRLRGRLVSLAGRSAYGASLAAVEVFLGVPYASPPVGTLRFLPPMNAPHWEDVRDADRFGPVCPQTPPVMTLASNGVPATTGGASTGPAGNVTAGPRRPTPAGRADYLNRISRLLLDQSEDCLYLNVYTPAKVSRSNQKLPVVMFIHGGGYDWGSGNAFDGSVLASFANVVFVTINYRLGILGFFPAMEHASRANNGLLDQVAALHWIHRNIDAFGGDPGDVTVFGHGSGAACVNFLMMYPMAKDLFRRGVMMSGSALSAWAVARDAATFARQSGRALGCTPAAPAAGAGAATAFVECLRHRPAEQLIAAAARLHVADHLVAFGPTIDGSVVASEPRLEMASPASPFAQHDLLFGVVKFEDGYFGFSAHEEKHGFETERRDRIMRTLVRNLYSYHQQEILLTIINEYTDWTRSIQHPISILEETAEALSDALVVGPIVETGTLHAQAVAYRRTHSTTNFYVFNYHSEDSLYVQKTGCVHGEDLPYVLGVPLLGGGSDISALFRNYSRQEAQLSEIVMSYWGNFFWTGSPNSTNSDMNESDRFKHNKLRGFDRVGWPVYEPVHQKLLSIGLKPKVRDHYNAHRLSIWNRLIPKLHRAGGAALSRDHHLLEDFDNQASYAGVVRNISLITSTLLGSMPASFGGGVRVNPSGSHPSHVQQGHLQPDIEGRPLMPHIFDGSEKIHGNGSSESQLMSGLAGFPPGTYSTALGVTIAVGCSLLILNILIFAGVYYQRDKGRGSKVLETGGGNHKVQPTNSIRETTQGAAHSCKSSREASTPLQLRQAAPPKKVSTLPRQQPRSCMTTTGAGVAGTQPYQTSTLQRHSSGALLLNPGGTCSSSSSSAAGVIESPFSAARSGLSNSSNTALISASCYSRDPNKVASNVASSSIQTVRAPSHRGTDLCNQICLNFSSDCRSAAVLQQSSLLTLPSKVSSQHHQQQQLKDDLHDGSEPCADTLGESATVTQTSLAAIIQPHPIGEPPSRVLPAHTKQPNSNEVCVINYHY